MITQGYRSIKPRVKARAFLGEQNKSILVIAGDHGSEQAGVEIAEKLIELLSDKNTKLKSNIIVIPILFKGNYINASTFYSKINKMPNPSLEGDSIESSIISAM
jgi:predicted deacylase